MKTSFLKKTALVVTVSIIILLGVRVLIQTLIKNHDSVTLHIIDTEIIQQRARVVATADLTRQNGADAETEQIVSDCKGVDRQRFDTLLDSLSQSITTVELAELDVLFYKCGNFYAERKSVMSARLHREVAFFADLLSMRSHINPYDAPTNEEIQAWQKIATAELTWSKYFNDLVTYQGTIITLLRSGKAAAAPDVVAVLSQVKNARQQMEVLGSEIKGYRDTTTKI